ncbi:unnamed protein product [Sphenostylis stenocarpa]|uniref:Uncharacterized protein n=1 Tax=Sphenostylis stenocarpa TaxID=92480 RepID=A0AA86SVZ7_9FABA|nr:unnamed protein product [Sphenostylis stenocarpa]
MTPSSLHVGLWKQSLLMAVWHGAYEGPSKLYAEGGVGAYAQKMLGVPKSEKEEIECLLASIVPYASRVL